jgi:hypothetical protein
MEKNDRIQLELVYQTIVDRQNQDLETDLTISNLVKSLPDSWITRLLT